jgi:hypothetical protein
MDVIRVTTMSGRTITAGSHSGVTYTIFMHQNTGLGQPVIEINRWLEDQEETSEIEIVLMHAIESVVIDSA